MAKTRICDTFGLGRETTWGDGQSANIFVPTSDPIDVKPVNNYLEDDYANCRLESPAGGTQIVSQMSEVSANGNIRENSFGALLMAAFGKVTTTADTPETGVHTHEFEVKTVEPNVPVSYQIETGLGVMNDSGVQQVKGAVLDKLDMDFTSQQFATFSSNWKGRFPESGANGGFVAPTENPFLVRHISAKLADDVAGLSGASGVKFISMKLSIEKGVQEDFTIGDGSPTDIFPTLFKVSGSIEIQAEDSTYFDFVKDDIRKAMVIELANPQKTIGTASNPSLTFTLPKVNFTEWAMNGGLRDKAVQGFNFVGNFDATESAMLKAVLVNTESAY